MSWVSPVMGGKGQASPNPISPLSVWTLTRTSLAAFSVPSEMRNGDCQGDVELEDLDGLDLHRPGGGAGRLGLFRGQGVPAEEPGRGDAEAEHLQKIFSRYTH